MADTKIEKTDLAYFAGFFDGEGHIGIYPKKYLATIGNTDKLPLERAKELWGGSITYQDRGLNQRIWRWSVYGANSRKFLEDILPYVLNKKAQIEVYLRVLDVIPKGAQGRKGYDSKVREIINAGASKLRLLKWEVALT